MVQVARSKLTITSGLILPAGSTDRDSIAGRPVTRIKEIARRLLLLILGCHQCADRPCMDDVLAYLK